MMDMADATQVALTVSVPTLAVLIGILVSNSRLNDLNKRIGGEVMDARLSRIEAELHLR
jgi:hypothetical protein